MNKTHFLCDLFQQHKWEILREEWMEPPKSDKAERYPAHLQFLRCPYCMKTKAVLTHPEDWKNLHSEPSNDHRAEEPLPFPVG